MPLNELDIRMTTRVLLIRHGTTLLTAEDRFAGVTDVELSDEGRLQAERLAHRLAGLAVAAVYCSPMKRTIETAQILARPHDLTPMPKEGLREIDHGRWEGLRRKEAEARFPEEYAAWEADPFTFAPQGGETGISVLSRARPVLHDLVLMHEGELILVISHKATIRLLISNLLGIDPRGFRDRLDQAPACLNVLDFKDPMQARLMLFNDVSHYAADSTQDHPPRPKEWETPSS